MSEENFDSFAPFQQLDTTKFAHIVKDTPVLINPRSNEFYPEMPLAYVVPTKMIDILAHLSDIDIPENQKYSIVIDKNFLKLSDDIKKFLLYHEMGHINNGHLDISLSRARLRTIFSLFGIRKIKNEMIADVESVRCHENCSVAGVKILEIMYNVYSKHQNDNITTKVFSYFGKKELRKRIKKLKRYCN